ncbi:hypothetical protein DY000_02022750 [Brassica cretica]|uniref:SWIM-type domain-containing protein n=1 Tax=Brassica cretica TaxID=69181 RepID=A0ABQ7ELM1_BRACR|nr:hypothetical protein DY000_02022750 [Brassica cretica]
MVNGGEKSDFVIQVVDTPIWCQSNIGPTRSVRVEDLPVSSLAVEDLQMMRQLHPVYGEWLLKDCRWDFVVDNVKGARIIFLGGEGSRHSRGVEYLLDVRSEIADMMTVQPIDGWRFFVKGGKMDCVVDLEHGKCDCGVYAVEKIPCSHTIAAGTSAGSGCENGGENDGDNGGEITGGENDGLGRIDGNRLRNRL